MSVRTEIIAPSPDNPYLTGRHIEHDDRSIPYAYAAQPWRSLRTTVWRRHIPILDQQDLHAQGIHVDGDPDGLGSCTAQAGTGFLGTMPWFNSVGSDLALQLRDAVAAEKYAIELYSEATAIDDIDGQWPTQDTGSSGLAIAKLLVKRGLMKTYLHAFGLTPALSALQSQPILVGIPWYESMFSPRPNGTMEIAGSVAGGHEVVVDAIYLEQKMVRFPNSWGPSWGNEGYGFWTFDQFDSLLSQDGDVVVPYR